MAKKYNYTLSTDCQCARLLSNIGLTATDYSASVNTTVYVTFATELNTYQKEQLDQAMTDSGYSFVNAEDV